MTTQRNIASKRKTITDGTDNETFGDGHKDSKPSAITGLFSDKSDVYDVNEFGLLTQYHPPYPPHTYGPPPKKKVASKKKVKPKKKHQLYVVPYWDDVAIGPLIDPNDNNVLCGRGGHINHHAGNKQFLRIICSKQWEYLAQNTIKGKHLIATEIVCGIRAMVPAGQFLKKNNDTTTWFDIGDAKAIKKKLHRLFKKH